MSNLAPSKLTASILAISFALMGAAPAFAQIDKAASNAADAAEHKIDQKRADSDAKKSGPVGKVVNGVKSDYHQSQSKRSAEKAKQALKDAG